MSAAAPHLLVESIELANRDALIVAVYRDGVGRHYWHCHSCATKQPKANSLAGARRSGLAHAASSRHERNTRRLYGKRFD